MKFEIYQSPTSAAQNLIGGGGKWRWRLRASNGEVLASGEEFERKESCLASIALVISTTTSTPIVQV